MLKIIRQEPRLCELENIEIVVQSPEERTSSNGDCYSIMMLDNIMNERKRRCIFEFPISRSLLGPINSHNKWNITFHFPVESEDTKILLSKTTEITKSVNLGISRHANKLSNLEIKNPILHTKYIGDDPFLVCRITLQTQFQIPIRNLDGNIEFKKLTCKNIINSELICIPVIQFHHIHIGSQLMWSSTLISCIICDIMSLVDVTRQQITAHEIGKHVDLDQLTMEYHSHHKMVIMTENNVENRENKSFGIGGISFIENTPLGERIIHNDELLDQLGVDHIFQGVTGKQDVEDSELTSIRLEKIFPSSGNY